MEQQEKRLYEVMAVPKSKGQTGNYDTQWYLVQAASEDDVRKIMNAQPDCSPFAVVQTQPVDFTEFMSSMSHVVYLGTVDELSEADLAEVVNGRARL